MTVLATDDVGVASLSFLVDGDIRASGTAAPFTFSLTAPGGVTSLTLGAKAVDFGKLCIKPKEKIWMVWLDMHAVDYDGNLFDACSLGGIAALLTSNVPASKITDIPGVEPMQDFPMPVKEIPIMTTAIKLGGQILFDPTSMEEKVGGPRLSVSYDRDGNIRAMQKGLNGAFTKDEVRTIVRKGAERAAELREIVLKSI